MAIFRLMIPIYRLKQKERLIFEMEKIGSYAKLDSAILDKLNITSTPMAMRIQTNVQADIQGFKNSNLEGKIELVNSSIEHNKKDYISPSF